MSHDISETIAGTYKEPFTQIQYGVFAEKSDGAHFVAASWSPHDAIRRATEYYEEMNKFPHNNMDMSEVDRFRVRQRTVTYDLWEAIDG